MRIAFLLLLPLALFASKILSYNVYDRSDRVDLMFTFDTPYEGTISEQTMPSKIIIKLEDANIESQKIKQLTSPYLSKLVITPISNFTQVTAYIPADVKLEASKTSDEYGLRLRFVKPASAIKQPANTAATLPSSLATKPDIDVSAGYYVVIALLVASLGLVFYLKKKVANPNNTKKTNIKPARKGWLFNPKADSSQDVNVRFSKQVDQTHKVIMLDYGTLSYLVLIGNDTVLLDKFEDNKPVTNNEFEEILKARNEELTELLQLNHAKEEEEPFQSYKNKAASIAYDV